MILPGREVCPGGLVLHADALGGLRQLPSGSIQCCATSPPYWQQRDYGCPVLWPDGSLVELGQEHDPEVYIRHLVEVFRELRRVLRDDGSFWLNLGDTIGGSRSGPIGKTALAGGTRSQERSRIAREGGSAAERMPRKQIMGLPFRIALALQADGWVWRAWCPWIKRNGLPESVKDRPTCPIEVVHLFSKVEDGYYYDPDAVRVPHTKESVARIGRSRSAVHKYTGGGPVKQSIATEGGLEKALSPGGRSRRAADWWFDSLRDVLDGGEGMVLGEDGEPAAFVVNPRGFRGAHYAVFPPRLVEPCILAGSPPASCSACGAPRRRVVEKGSAPSRPLGSWDFPGSTGAAKRWWRAQEGSSTLGWQPSCACEAPDMAAWIADPFGGVATTMGAALAYGRRALVIEPVESNIALMEQRVLEVAKILAMPPRVVPRNPDDALSDAQTSK